ncbi:MAG: universal stress protein [Candidatus Binatia bacterium]
MTRTSTSRSATIFDRILVPHDFSDHATRALEIAASLAGPTSTITVLHAQVPVYTSMGGPAGEMTWTPPPEMAKELSRDLKELAARTVGRALAGRVQCKVVAADPLTAILAAARRADVIIMTTVGRTGLSHLLMGSIAEKVVRHATTPVLTIHPNSARRLTKVKTRRAPAKRKRVSPR